MVCMFDTNAISALVHQRRGYERIAARIERLDYGERLLSAITLSELQTMVEKAGDPSAKGARVWRIVMNFRIVDFDEEAARHAGRIRAQLEPRGIKIGPLDTLIAAHALAHRAILVTDNVREFGRVDGLKLKNWIEAGRDR